MAGYTLDEVNAFPDAPTAGGSQGYSFDEVNALPDAPEPEEPGLVKSFAKAVVDPLSKIGGSVAKALLPKSMEGSLASGKVKSVFGDDVNLVGYRDGRELKGSEYTKDLVGTAMEGASYLPMSGLAVQGAKLFGKALTGTKIAQKIAPKVGTLAAEGAIAGGLIGTGSALQENKDISTSLGEGAIGAAVGAAGVPLLGHYAPKAVGSIGKTIGELSNKEGRLARNVASREKDIYDIETGYTKLNQKNAYKEDARNESRSRIANTDVLVNTVDADGKINTKAKGGAIDQYKSQTIDGREAIVKDLLKKEGKQINISDVTKYLEKTILEDEKLAGGSLESAYSRINSTVKGLERKADANGNIPLDLLHSAKISETANINYSVPSSKAEAKAVARALKELIENSSAQNIKEINDELAKYYSDIEMLADLDGKKVKGGRLGKYFASGTGNIIGGLAGMSTGGPIGGAIGAAIGGEVSGRILGSQMANTFGKALGKTAEKSKVLQKAEESAAKLPLALPAPKFGRDFVPNQEYNRGIPKMQYNNAQTTIKASIPNSLPRANNAVKKGSVNSTKKPIGQDIMKERMGVFPKTLEQEATKYKTAEEFVKSKGQPLLHGTTQDFKEFDLSKAGTRNSADSGFAGKGIYLTNSKEVADTFASGKDVFKTQGKTSSGRVIETYIDIPKERILEVKDFSELEDVLYLPKSSKRPSNITLTDFLKEQSPKITEKAKEMGYKAIKVDGGGVDKYGTEAYEIVVFDPKDIKTKSQLTDIWNKANNKK